MSTVSHAETAALILALGSLTVHLAILRVAWDAWQRERDGRLNGERIRRETALTALVEKLGWVGFSAITVVYTLVRMRIPSLPAERWEVTVVMWIPVVYGAFGALLALWNHRYHVRMLDLLEQHGEEGG